MAEHPPHGHGGARLSDQPGGDNAARARSAVLALLFSSTIWGCIWWPLQRFAAAGLPGLPLLLVAYGVVAALMAPMLWRHRAALRAHWRPALLIAVSGGYASLAFNLSLAYGDVIRAMALFYTLPVWAVIGGRFWLGEAITPPRIAAVACALAGAWLVLGGTRILAAPPSWPDLLALTAGVAFAANNIGFRIAQQVPVPAKMALMFASCTLFAALLVGGGVQAMPSGLPLALWGLALLFGLCWLLPANAGSQWGVTHLEAGRASVIIIMELVAAVITSMWWGDTQLAPLEWAGVALVSVAALLEARG